MVEYCFCSIYYGSACISQCVLLLSAIKLKNVNKPNVNSIPCRFMYQFIFISIFSSIFFVYLFIFVYLINYIYIYIYVHVDITMYSINT